jgi:hypothetical protein
MRKTLSAKEIDALDRREKAAENDARHSAVIRELQNISASLAKIPAPPNIAPQLQAIATELKANIAQIKPPEVDLKGFNKDIDRRFEIMTAKIVDALKAKPTTFEVVRNSYGTITEVKAK